MEHKIYTTELGGKPLSLEFGKYAQQAGGSVLVRYGDTVGLGCATMSAQAVTPMFAGMVMDNISSKGLFVYSAIFVFRSIVLMLFVKHGDSKPIGKGKKLTKEEKRQIRLESLDN